MTNRILSVLAKILGAPVTTPSTTDNGTMMHSKSVERIDRIQGLLQHIAIDCFDVLITREAAAARINIDGAFRIAGQGAKVIPGRAKADIEVALHREVQVCLREAEPERPRDEVDGGGPDFR
jgi:hypothetical protein